MAIAMPAMPIRLPWRAVAGELRPRSARMKQTAAARYPSATRLFMPRPLAAAPVHAEHALGYREPAEEVDRCQDDGEEAEPGRRGETLGAGRDQGADDDHAGDRVGHRHQRRVQRRGDAPHHVVADEDREHEGDQVVDRGVDRWHSWFPTWRL